MYSVAIEWKDECPDGRIEVRNGELKSLEIGKGSGFIQGNSFSRACRLVVEIGSAKLDHESDPTVVSVLTENASFSFILRDVSSEFPIYIPQYGAAVVPVNDQRNYEDIERAIRSLNTKTKLEQIEADDEESYDNAAAHTRSLHCPTWLGIGQDIRLFEFDDDLINHWGQLGPCIKPRYPIGYLADKYEHAESKGYIDPHYNFKVGRGVGCVSNRKRRLEDGVLPIGEYTPTSAATGPSGSVPNAIISRWIKPA